MPTGPGLLYEKQGSYFKISSMHACEQKSSLMAVEWLEYENSRCPFKAQIKHALNGGEVKINGYYVDGYIEICREDGSLYKVGYQFFEKDFLFIFFS